MTLKTAEKWIKSNEHHIAAWLDIKASNGLVTSMSCKCCKQFKDGIISLRNYSPEWVTGTSNVRLSAAKSHAASSPHSYAYDLYCKFKEKANYVAPQPVAGQSTISENLQRLSSKHEEDLKRKFDVSYFVAKEEIPIAKYKAIIELEERHSVNFHRSYKNDTACGEMIDCISSALTKEMKDEIGKARFFSVLFDGSSKSVSEKEAVLVMYFDPEPKNSDLVEVKTGIVSIESLTHGGNAAGLVKTLKQSLSKIGVQELDASDDNPILIGLGSDGASVNKDGVTKALKELSPWLVFMWCVAHRLELALKDSFKETFFSSIDDMLLKMFYLYEKSPKKFRLLQDVYDNLKSEIDFQSKKVKPVKACGSRWIGHKHEALKHLYDKFGVIMKSIHEMCSDNSFTAADRAKFSSYFKKWTGGKYVLHIPLLLDVLQPAVILSLAFQTKEADVVKVSRSLKQTSSTLQGVRDKDVQNLPYVKDFIKKVSEQTYQGITIRDYERHLEGLHVQKQEYVDLIQNVIDTRLGGSDSDTIHKSAVILDTEN